MMKFVYTIGTSITSGSSHARNGEFDILKRKYSREKVTLTTCKYLYEVHLCLGVADLTPVIDGV